MPIDKKEYSQSGVTTPAGSAKEITAGITILPTFSRALYVGLEGTLVVTMAADDVQITFTNVAAGSVLPLRVSSVDAGTTAGDIVALF